MSGNPDGDEPRTRSEIEEDEEEEATPDPQIKEEDAVRAMFKDLELDETAEALLEELISRQKKEKTTTLRDLIDKEKKIIIDPPFIDDQVTHSMFYFSSYVGSSFNGMIKVYTGLMVGVQQEDPNDPSPTSGLIIAKSVAVQEPPSQAQNDLQERVRISGLVPDHPNIVGVERSLTAKNKFFVIFRNVSCNKSETMVSLRSVLRNHFPMGMPLTFIVVCLREALKGLSEIHRVGEVHKEITAGQIFLGQDNAVKLAFSATTYEYDDPVEDINAASSSSSLYLPISKICKWASAPEVYDRSENEAAAYDRKSDIWLIGIVAVELAYGGFEATDRAQLERMLEKIHRKKKLPSRPLKKKEKSISVRRFISSCIRPEAQIEKEVWKDFQAMVMKCLQIDVNSRPSVEELLSFKIFVDEEKDAAYVFQWLSDIEASKED